MSGYCCYKRSGKPATCVFIIQINHVLLHYYDRLRSFLLACYRFCFKFSIILDNLGTCGILILSRSKFSKPIKYTLDTAIIIWYRLCLNYRCNEWEMRKLMWD